MDLLNFNYQKAVSNGQSKDELASKIADALQNNGCNVSKNNNEITVKGVKSYFNVGDATIRVEDSAIKVEGTTKPSIAALVCVAISLVFDLIGLFSSCELEEVLVMALVIALGAAGTIGTLITFFVGKELLCQKIALLVNGVEK